MTKSSRGVIGVSEFKLQCVNFDDELRIDEDEESDEDDSEDDDIDDEEDE